MVSPWHFFISPLLIVATLVAHATAACQGPRTPGELRNTLWGAGSGYDRFTRPNVAEAAIRANNNSSDLNAVEPFQAEPDNVRAQMHVLALTSVDQKRNEYQINIWFRIRWHDFRLEYLSDQQGGCFSAEGREGYPESALNEIWHPDIYVENQVKINQNVAGSVWVYPSGDVVHVQQLLITLSCDMDFENFPYDEQTCGFKIGTWLEDARGVTMDFWQNGAITLASNQTKEAGQLPQGGTNEWVIKSARGVDKEEGKLHGATQAESSVELVFVLERVADYYSDFVILPAVMFVTIGWCSFFIGRNAAPARVAMSIIGFLANTNFLASQLSQLPRLGNEVLLLRFLYLSALFCFYSVIEYVLCNYLYRIQLRVDGHRKKAEDYVVEQQRMQLQQQQKQQQQYSQEQPKGKRKKKAAQQQQQDPEQPPPPQAVPAQPVPVTKQDYNASGFHYRVDSLLLNRRGHMVIRDEHVDIFSRYVYPIAYITFSCIIWFG